MLLDLPNDVLQNVASYCDEISLYILKSTSKKSNESFQLNCSHHPNPFQSFCIRSGLCSNCYKPKVTFKDVNPIKNLCIACSRILHIVFRQKRYFNFVTQRIQKEDSESTVQVYMDLVDVKFSPLVSSNAIHTDDTAMIDQRVDVFINKYVVRIAARDVELFAIRNQLHLKKIFGVYSIPIPLFVATMDVHSVNHFLVLLSYVNQFIEEINAIVTKAYRLYWIYKTPGLSLVPIELGDALGSMTRFLEIMKRPGSENDWQLFEPVSIFATFSASDKQEHYKEMLIKTLNRTLMSHRIGFYKQILVLNMSNLHFDFEKDPMTTNIRYLKEIILQNTQQLAIEFRRRFIEFLNKIFKEFNYSLTHLNFLNPNDNLACYIQFFVSRFTYIDHKGAIIYLPERDTNEYLKYPMQIHKLCLRTTCNYCESVLFPDNSCSCTRLHQSKISRR